MNMSTKMYIAEFIGTAALVLIGCGAITIGGLGGALGLTGTGGFEKLGVLSLLPIAMAFGMTVTSMAYGIGPISGCHVNPAVSVGVWASGRIDTGQLIGYIIAQVLGAIAGAAILYIILSGKVGGYDLKNGLGETTWSGNVSLVSAFVAEFVATFLFLVVILGATSQTGSTPVAGLAIGLTLMVIHLAFIRATGASVNPARSIGPALFVGGDALKDLWLYLVAPTLGAFVAGLLYKNKTLDA
jgi:aquaporin Z